ncbi:uncharacterized protein [Pyxicephalus adspersus]|uniref:uncharacterized protein n=1 Tax=Pyxicephalus adspersus TaxID=30357 RepID=UPI003B5ACDED
MAVVYADLRFSRPQRDGIPESPCDDWEVTYENITPPKETQRGEEGNPPKVKGPKGFWAGYSHYVTLCVISVASLTTIIVLSVQLSLVTRQYDESSNMLEILQRDHGHLKSSLTSDIFRKESVARELQETIRKTKEELEITKHNLRVSPEEGERNKQKLQSILQEKAQADITITNLRRNLQDTENQLQGKSNELSGCKNNLESAMRQKRKDNQEITNLKNALTATKRDLSTEKADLARKTEELSTVRKTLSDLQEEQEKSQLQLKKLHDLEEKMRVAKNCFFKTCDGEKNEEKSDTAAICPWGWKKMDEMCYYFSSQSDVRYKAAEDCTMKNATLAKIQESDSTLKSLSYGPNQRPLPLGKASHLARPVLNEDPDPLFIHNRGPTLIRPRSNHPIDEMTQNLTATKRDLSTEKADLARKTEELSTVRKTLSDLQEEQEKSQLQLKKLHDLEEKMRVAKNCFFKTCDGEKNEEKSDTAAICPWGWKKMDEMCYYFSSQSDVRYKAAEDCTMKNATLAKIQESDSTLKDWIREEGKHFWIGLSKIHNEWKWSDGSIEKDLQSKGDLCAKASPTLHVQSCSSSLPWICQKKAMECRLGMENLRCFMEKINI